MSQVVVALGGNLGGSDVIMERFDAAILSLSHTWGPARVSACYLSAPLGAVPDQGEFVNAAASWPLTACPSPEETLAILQGLERQHGRSRSIAGGPRTLDLDLLLHGSSERSARSLLLPHPRIGERAFVLRPLRDLFGAEYRWLGSSQSVGECLEAPRVASQVCVLTRPCSPVRETHVTGSFDV